MASTGGGVEDEAEGLTTSRILGRCGVTLRRSLRTLALGRGRVTLLIFQSATLYRFVLRGQG